ncbi:MAG: hypothetical protein NT133_00130, partial [Alphaproteobacteria bacterium]|nr:hypothetical protein [Alphaproteobacteria bacterium]
MPADLRAKRAQKPWQDMEQNQRGDDRGLDGTGGDQPKPCAGCRQTAQSCQRGCHNRSRSAAVTGLDIVLRPHAACLPASPWAAWTSARIACLLNWKV